MGGHHYRLRVPPFPRLSRKSWVVLSQYCLSLGRVLRAEAPWASSPHLPLCSSPLMPTPKPPTLEPWLLALPAPVSRLLSYRVTPSGNSVPQFPLL